MKRLVLFNGGLKDTFLAELAKREGEVVLYYFMLEPRDQDRLYTVGKLATTLRIPLSAHNLIGAPALEETLLRMLYLVLHAIPYAKLEQCKCIYHGLSIDDDPRVVPILDAYVKQLNALVQLAQPLYDAQCFYLGQVAIETPLRRLDRARVIRLGNEWNIPWEDTFSCEHNIKRHCGMCFGCLRRRAAFKQEGHEDPVFYGKE